MKDFQYYIEVQKKWLIHSLKTGFIRYNEKNSVLMTSKKSMKSIFNITDEVLTSSGVGDYFYHPCYIAHAGLGNFDLYL